MAFFTSHRERKKQSDTQDTPAQKSHDPLGLRAPMIQNRQTAVSDVTFAYGKGKQNMTREGSSETSPFLSDATISTNDVNTDLGDNARACMYSPGFTRGVSVPATGRSIEPIVNQQARTPIYQATRSSTKAQDKNGRKPTIAEADDHLLVQISLNLGAPATLKQAQVSSQGLYSPKREKKRRDSSSNKGRVK